MARVSLEKFIAWSTQNEWAWPCRPASVVQYLPGIVRTSKRSPKTISGTRSSQALQFELCFANQVPLRVNDNVDVRAFVERNAGEIESLQLATVLDIWQLKGCTNADSKSNVYPGWIGRQALLSLRFRYNVVQTPITLLGKWEYASSISLHPYLRCCPKAERPRFGTSQVGPIVCQIWCKTRTAMQMEEPLLRQVVRSDSR